VRALNLLPKEESYGGKSAPLPLLVGLGLGVLVLVALSAGYLQASGKVADRKQTLQDSQAQLSALPIVPADRTSSIQSALTAAQQPRVAAVSQALSRRVVWDRLLRELSQVLPDDVWLSSLTAKSPILATSAITPAGPVPGAAPTGFVLNGFTYSQDGVARALARFEVLPDLTNVQLQTSALTTIGERNVVSFTILADIRTPIGAS
jgi:Tfp pilus assembly protein PilN